MNTYCFTPVNGDHNEIIIHAWNVEAARAKLEEYVSDVTKWKLS